MCSLIIALVLLSDCSMSVLGGRAQMERQNFDKSVEKVPILQLLEELGEKYQKYFTIEECWTEGNSSARLFARMVPHPSARRNVFQELDELKISVPYFTYYVDEKQPNIIHISDTRIGQQREYALDMVIKNIDFKGNVFDLVSALNQQGIRVSSRGIVMGAEEMLVIDFMTPVHVKGVQLKVRDALSHFIPLKGRSSRLLWIAETKHKPLETTYIRFRGAATPASH